MNPSHLCRSGFLDTVSNERESQTRGNGDEREERSGEGGEGVSEISGFRTLHVTQGNLRQGLSAVFLVGALKLPSRESDQIQNAVNSRRPAAMDFSISSWRVSNVKLSKQKADSSLKGRECICEFERLRA